MSMIGNYFMLDEETVNKIKNKEISVESLIYDENDNVDEEITLDIDKTWHAIHFMLTGDAGVSNDQDLLLKTVIGGEPISDEEVGYSPALLITKEEVNKINDHIQNISEHDFRNMFNFKDLIENEIYPVMNNEDEGIFFQYVWSYFERLKDFYNRAAKAEKCLLFYIN